MNVIKLFKRFAAVVAIGASLAAPALAQSTRGPTTPEEQARIVQLAAAADKDPVGVMTSAEGRWFEKWAEEAPDYMLGPDKGVFWLHASGTAQGSSSACCAFTIR